MLLNRQTGFTNPNCSVSQLAKNISLLDAMHLLKGSWQSVKQTTVVICFAIAGFVVSPDEEEEVEEPPTGLTLSKFQTFVDMDSSLECHGLLTDEEICSSISHPESEPKSRSGDEEREVGMTTNPARMPKPAEVLQAMGTVRSFLELNETELTTFYTMESQVLKLFCNTAKQTSMVTSSHYLHQNTDYIS